MGDCPGIRDHHTTHVGRRVIRTEVTISPSPAPVTGSDGSNAVAWGLVAVCLLLFVIHRFIRNRTGGGTRKSGSSSWH